MMPPRKDPSKRPGSKGPVGPPAGGPPRPGSKAPGPPVGKAASKPLAKPGAPPPAPAGKASKPMMRSGGSSGPLRRPAPSASGPGKKSNVKMIALGAAGGILALIGILFGILSGQVNPEEIKAELKAKLEEIEKMPPEQIIEKHKKLKELQGNPLYDTKNCGAVRKQLDKAVDDTRPLAERQEKADQDVGPFLDQLAQAEASLDTPKAQNLLDKASALLNDYGTTPYREKLEAAKKKLIEWLEAHTSNDTPDAAWIPLKTAVDRAAEEHDFKRANDQVAAYERQWEGRLSSTLTRNLDELKASLERKRKKFVEDTLGEAKDLNERGQTAEAQTKLKQAMEKVQGLEGYSELEGALKNLGGN